MDLAAGTEPSGLSSSPRSLPPNSRASLSAGVDLLPSRGEHAHQVVLTDRYDGDHLVRPSRRALGGP